ALSLSGALPDFKTFDSEITTESIRNLKISGVNSLSFVQENLDFAREQGAAEIEAALNDLVSAYETRTKAKATSASVAAFERRLTRLETKVKAKATSASVSAFERRLTRLETNAKATKARAVAAEKSVRKLQKLLPIRT